MRAPNGSGRRVWERQGRSRQHHGSLRLGLRYGGDGGESGLLCQPSVDHPRIVSEGAAATAGVLVNRALPSIGFA